MTTTPTPLARDARSAALTWRPQRFAESGGDVSDPLIEPLWTGLRVLAHVDGATRWQQFWKITLPLLRPALLVALIFRTLDSFRVFDVIYVMKGTAPETVSVAILARQTMFDLRRLGEGAAETPTLLAHNRAMANDFFASRPELDVVPMTVAPATGLPLSFTMVTSARPCLNPPVND